MCVEKIKYWFKKNKKYVLIGGTIILSAVGTGIVYAVCKDKKVFLSDWLKSASKEELEDAYEQMRLDFQKTGIKSSAMEQIGHELGERGAKEWFEKHPPNTDPLFQWTDVNRWDKD